MPKGAGRYKPGGYRRPRQQEIEVGGLGSFLVRPLSNKDQREIKKPFADAERDEEAVQKVYMALISAALVEPAMSPTELDEESDKWTSPQWESFFGQALEAAAIVDTEALDEVRRRFRPQDDD